MEAFKAVGDLTLRQRRHWHIRVVGNQFPPCPVLIRDRPVTAADNQRHLQRSPGFLMPAAMFRNVFGNQKAVYVHQDVPP